MLISSLRAAPSLARTLVGKGTYDPFLERRSVHIYSFRDFLFVMEEVGTGGMCWREPERKNPYPYVHRGGPVRRLEILISFPGQRR